MTESESGEEESGGREKGGSFDLRTAVGREGGSRPFAASVVLAAEEREMKIVGEKSAIRPSVSIAPRRTRQPMKPLLKQTNGFTIALECRIVRVSRIFIPVGFFNADVWPHRQDLRPVAFLLLQLVPLRPCLLTRPTDISK